MAAKQPGNSLVTTNGNGTGRKPRKATSGSWRPGQSGNPKGRPPTGMSLAERIRLACGDDGDAYVTNLHRIAVGQVDEQGEIPNTKAQIEAAKVLLERGFGRPPQEVNITSESKFLGYTRHELEMLPPAKLALVTDLARQIKAILMAAYPASGA